LGFKNVGVFGELHPGEPEKIDNRFRQNWMVDVLKKVEDRL
jgi:hypothetical protein